MKCVSQEGRSCGHKLNVEITELDTAGVCFWLQRFVLEVRKGNGEHYCPDSLHQLCCGLQRALRNADRDMRLVPVCPVSLRSCGELKRLNGTGNYIHKKKANVITVEMEEILWEKGLLRDCSPQVLSDTVVYLIGLFFCSEEW